MMSMISAHINSEDTTSAIVPVHHDKINNNACSVTRLLNCPESSHPGSGNATRLLLSKQRKRDRDKARRAAMSAEKRALVNERRRELYAQKKVSKECANFVAPIGGPSPGSIDVATPFSYFDVAEDVPTPGAPSATFGGHDYVGDGSAHARLKGHEDVQGGAPPASDDGSIHAMFGGHPDVGDGTPPASGGHHDVGDDVPPAVAACAIVEQMDEQDSEDNNPVRQGITPAQGIAADNDTTHAAAAGVAAVAACALVEQMDEQDSEDNSPVCQGITPTQGITPFAAVHNEVEDEGYLGGHEGGFGSCDDEEGDVGTTNGFDLDSEDEEEDVGTTNGQPASTTSCKNVDAGPVGHHLGDCSCIADGDTHGGDSEDGGDSDSDESEDEDEQDMNQEIYVEKAQLDAPYKKRKRASPYIKRPNCRPPRLIGAIDRAMRNAKKRVTEFIFEPILGMVFDSRHEAKEFYNMYSWEVGFGVKFNTNRPGARRRGNEAANQEEDGEEYLSMQEITCQKNGSDDRTVHGSKRCGCPAKIRLLRTDDHGWYISFVEKKHNHEFSRTDAQKREWSSHRQIEGPMREMIRTLRQHNINLTKVDGILEGVFARKGDVTWTKRSLRTVCNQIAREQMDDDIKKTMEIFGEMRDKDPGFQFSVELDKRSRIRTLLWCSGRGRDQYECFGDVITFDTTYCTNIYKMPFGLFVGVNNHFQTTIFGGVLMRRETAKSFKWVFKEFLKLMGGKAPQTILTDQCKAMTKAIRIVMPNTYHLWCKWHVMKKIRECLGILYTKNRKFRDEFWLVVNGMLSEDEFESGWSDLVNRYKLQENDFMKRLYNSKKKWAKPWSKDKFCARMSSTQRSESANFMLKRFVPRNSSMNHFVSQYSKLLYERDREEDIAEEKTRELKTVRGRLWAIERHALKVYTKAAFQLFRSEVDKASNYKIGETIADVCTVSHNDAEKRAHWQRVHFKVRVIGKGQKYVCECGLYEHFGILCCHSLRIMIGADIPEIPAAHIMKRWTRNARDVIPERVQPCQKDKEAIQSTTFRHRLMRLNSEQLINTGDIDVELFEVVMKHIKNAQKEAAEVLAKRAKNAEVLQDEDSSDDDDDDEVGLRAGVQSDAETLRKKSADGSVEVQRNNKYGASGSSAHYSDTELVNIKAPKFKKKHGRPRGKRFLAGFECSKKKSKKSKANANNADIFGDGRGINGENNAKKLKRVIKCGRCGLDGHNATQCCSIEISEATATGYF